MSANLDALYGMALRLCDGHAADAEDLLQDAVLRAFHGFADLRDTAAGRSWLFTILVRTNLNRVRSRRRRPESLESDLDEGAFEGALADWSPAALPDEYADRALVRDRVERGLGSLDGALREVLWLVDVEGFTQREAGAMLGIPEGTIASRLLRARRGLRDALLADTSAASRGGRGT